VTAIAEVSEKLAKKRWVRLKLTWFNQKQELVAEGEALVMPPRVNPSRDCRH
jgi:acyl dehydratase